MARNRRRKGGAMRKILVVAGVLLAIWLVVHAKPYLDDQKTLQQYVNTHSTTQPAAPGR